MPYEGHIFIEAKVNDVLILIDSSSGQIVKTDYDRKNPVIPIHHGTQTKGYYVIKKGLDSWDMNIRSLDDLKKLQRTTAKKINFKSLITPKYVIERL